MKKQMQWCRHVKVWRESGLSQADYCRQQGLNAKTFSVWVRRVRDELPLGKDAPLEIIPIQVSSIGASRICPSRHDAPISAR